MITISTRLAGNGSRDIWEIVITVPGLEAATNHLKSKEVEHRLRDCLRYMLETDTRVEVVTET